MATLTPPSPPHAAAGSRRPFFIRWWYDPVQRRRAIIATVLALLYGSGLVYGSWTRVCSGDRCPSITRLQPDNERHAQLQTSKVYAADGRLISELGIELRTVLPLDAELADQAAIGGELGIELRTVLPLDQTPVHVRQAFLANEDKRFYKHNVSGRAPGRCAARCR